MLVPLIGGGSVYAPPGGLTLLGYFFFVGGRFGLRGADVLPGCEVVA